MFSPHGRDLLAKRPNRNASIRVGSSQVTGSHEQRLQQLSEKLFRNAVEHGSTSNRPVGDDAVEHDGESVPVPVGGLENGFYVEDDGPGIPEADREQVFESGWSTNLKAPASG